MINKNLLNVFLSNVSKDSLIIGIKEFINSIHIQSEYQEDIIVNNLINIMCGDNIITINDINKDVIIENISSLFHEPNDIDIDSIKVYAVDNLSKEVYIHYRYKEDKNRNYEYTTHFEIDAMPGVVMLK